KTESILQMSDAVQAVLTQPQTSVIGQTVATQPKTSVVGQAVATHSQQVSVKGQKVATATQTSIAGQTVATHSQVPVKDQKLAAAPQTFVAGQAVATHSQVPVKDQKVAASPQTSLVGQTVVTHSQFSVKDKKLAAAQASVAGQTVATHSQVPVKDQKVATAAKTSIADQKVATAPQTSSQVPIALFQNAAHDPLFNKHQVSVTKKSKVSSEVLTQAGMATHLSAKAMVSNSGQAPSVSTTMVQGTASGLDASTNMSGQQGSDSSSKDDRASTRYMGTMMDGSSLAQVRSTPQNFSAHMAYRTAQAFMPQDAMSEVARLAKEGMKKLELQLEPASLGKIQVTLQMDAAKQLQVHMMIDQSASKHILEQQLPQLRQALADQGLNLSGFTMDMNSQQGQGKRSEGQAFARQNASGVSAEHVELPTLVGVNTATHGRLNILA
ncbi:MAG: flagellar hook-length control protein FliK, partial [Mariprofundaceae bacterium]|nr:flagellar hook-length control protein FliK [Mariprofundaceae bacterium]